MSDATPESPSTDLTLPFFEQRFSQLLDQKKADGTPKWSQEDIDSVIPFLTIATVEKWDLANADDDQVIALHMTQEALGLEDFSDPASVQKALEAYFVSGKTNQELAQEVFRICEEVEEEFTEVSDEDKLKNEADALAAKAAEAARKHLKLSDKDKLEDGTLATAQAKVVGKEEIKRAPGLHEPKPEGSIDAATLAHQLSGRRRI